MGKTTTPPPNSTVDGVSVLDVWAGDSPHWDPQRARGQGRGLARKSRVLGRSGWKRRRGVGGKMRFGSGRRGTSEGSSLKVHGVTAHTASQKAHKLGKKDFKSLIVVLVDGQ